MYLTRKFPFWNAARLQCEGGINVLALKSWMRPIPIVHPHTYHIVHKTSIKKRLGTEWQGFVHLLMPVANAQQETELSKKLEFCIYFGSYF